MGVLQVPPMEFAHLVGIGGSGMKSLAEILTDLGTRVSGSDTDCDRPVIENLRAAGISIAEGHHADNVPASADALIHSPAIPAENPERERAAQLGLRQFALPEMLAELMRERFGVCIAGTHGKSTTTAMLAWILRSAGLSPSAFIGASLCDSNRGGWAGDGRHFVVESCEYQRNFLHFAPSHAVILGVEPDHFETYPDDDRLINAFAEFARRVKPDGTLTINGDCPRTMMAVERTGVAFETFGNSPAVEWRVIARDPRDFTKSLGSVTDFKSRGQLFELHRRGETVASISLPQPGSHNRVNAAAAAVLCLRMEIEREAIESALRTFPGISRRFEILEEFHGVTFLDDYAHHPTAVRLTLETARDVFPGRRIWCVFQPHQTARVRRLLPDFVAALSIADRILITPAFSARETDAAAAVACAEELVAATIEAGADCRCISSLDRILPCLEDRARPGDVVLFMGAGDIERIRYDHSRRISRHHAHE